MRDPDDPFAAYFHAKEFQPENIPDKILQLIPISVGREQGLVPVDEIGNTLVVASPRPIPTETIKILRFILNREVTNAVVPMDTFERLRVRYESV